MRKIFARLGYVAGISFKGGSLLVSATGIVVGARLFQWGCYDASQTFGAVKSAFSIVRYLAQQSPKNIWPLMALSSSQNSAYYVGLFQGMGWNYLGLTAMLAGAVIVFTALASLYEDLMAFLQSCDGLIGSQGAGMTFAPQVERMKSILGRKPAQSPEPAVVEDDLL